MHECPALTLALRLLQAVDTDSDEIITVDDLIVALLLKPDPYTDLLKPRSDAGSGDISMTTAYKLAKQEAEQIMRELGNGARISCTSAPESESERLLTESCSGTHCLSVTSAPPDKNTHHRNLIRASLSLSHLHCMCHSLPSVSVSPDAARKADEHFCRR